MVTAASTFDPEVGQPLSDWNNYRNWYVLPGAFNIPNIETYTPNGEYFTADWMKIIRFEIHPLYENGNHRWKKKS